MPLFEIVPNFSEGRDAAFPFDAAETIAGSGARLLHSTSDAAHHRSVLTIAGDGDSVVRAAVSLAGFAAERIDLRAHRGVHPRIGALDVLPFVPLRDASIGDAADLAHRAGNEIWERWRIPSFYYGGAARAASRRQLPAVRRGGFEGLDARFADPRWHPDVGNIAKHATAGAIAIGARDVLIAFNVELDTDDEPAALDIARALRGRDGGPNGLRALAFRMNDGRMQVSFNVTDVRSLALYRIVELVRRLAGRRGIAVARSELIGCLPLCAVKQTASYYLGTSEEVRLGVIDL
jgi:glutamate formiminotransferase / 5-formyltetrahydrofolate cyclo-ligase